MRSTLGFSDSVSYPVSYLASYPAPYLPPFSSEPLSTAPHPSSTRSGCSSNFSSQAGEKKTSSQKATLCSLAWFRGAWVEILKDMSTWEGKLYTLGTLFGTVSVSITIGDAASKLQERVAPGPLSIVSAACLTLTFLFKTPYILEKGAVLSFIVLFTWSFLWLSLTVVASVAQASALS